MLSERKTQSARANGAKSRGPKTAEGKARSARNATTHGLNSQVAVLENESAERFQQLRDAYIAELAPRNQVEADLVDQIVVARWRLERTWTLETALLDAEISRQRPEIEDEFEKIDEPTRTAFAFKSLADNSRALALLNRYQIRDSRTIQRALETLHRLRENEKQNLPSEPNPVSEHDEPTPEAAPQPTPHNLQPTADPAPPESGPGPLNLCRRSPNAEMLARLPKPACPALGPRRGEV